MCIRDSRYSVDSAVGLSLIVVLGPERFQQFLTGFRAIDEYFENTPLEENVVALMGLSLIHIWVSFPPGWTRP